MMERLKAAYFLSLLPNFLLYGSFSAFLTPDLNLTLLPCSNVALSL